MKRMAVLLVIVVSLLSILSGMACADMAKAEEQLRVLQANPSSAFELVLDKDGEYLIQHDTTKSVASGEVKALVEKAQKEEWPIVDIGSKGSDLVYTYKCSDGSRLVRRTSREDTSTNDRCDLIVAETDARISPDEFRPFLSKLQDYLLFCRAYKQDDNVMVEMGLMPPCPDKFTLGAQTFRATDKFRSYMRIAKDGLFTEGKSKQSVIIVHEPHWSTVGQNLTLLGLDEFIQSNNQAKPVFLIESAMQGEQCKVDGLLDMIPAGANRNRTIHTLLANHVIDGPSAYMALHAPDIKAWGMEDPVAYGVNPRRTFVDWNEYSQALKALFKAARTLPEEKSRKWLLATSYLVMKLRADTDGLHDNDYIAAIEDRAKAAGALRELVDEMTEDGASIEDAQKHRKTLADFQDNISLEAEYCRHGQARSKAMAENIVKYASSTQPVFAFIGNFHTHYITSQLKKNGINFVVIEAVDSTASTVEQQQYNEILEESQRSEYFKRVPLRKIAPNLWNESPEAYKGMISRIAQSSPAPPDDLAVLINDNPFFCGYKVGEMSEPPLEFSKALLVVDPKTSSVQVTAGGKERIKDLQAIMPYIPLIAKDAGDAIKRSLEQVRIGEHTISVVIDAETGRYFVFEGKDNGLNLLEPISRMSNKVILRWRLTRIPRIVRPSVS